MSTWVAWGTVAISIVLLAVLGVLLYRLISGERATMQANAQGKAPNAHYVPTTPDETMVISRQQADEMLNK